MTNTTSLPIFVRSVFLRNFFNNLNLTAEVKNCFHALYIVVHASVIQEFGKYRQGGQKFKIIFGSLANSGCSGPCQILSNFFKKNKKIKYKP